MPRIPCSWAAQKKVAWIGDYACDDYDPDNEAYAKVMPFEEFQRFYDAAHGEDCKALSAGLFTARDMGVLDYDTKKMFLVNHDKRVYIDMEAFIRENTARGGDWDGWCMNPLPLLTACGNNRGGGDFRQNGVGYEDIGIWAFDTLEYTSIVPKGFNEAIFFFNDHRRTTAV